MQEQDWGDEELWIVTAISPKIAESSTGQKSAKGEIKLLGTGIETSGKGLDLKESAAATVVPTASKPTLQNNVEPVSKAKGIDYRELEELLKAQEWRKADELTAKLMLKVANSQGWLDEDSIEIFPCEDLRTIDQLWVHYSNNKFGFSIQKKFWLECGGEIGKHDVKVWIKFVAEVGWYHPKNDDWKSYTEFMNDTKNAQNALPASLPCFGSCGYELGGECWWV